MPLPRIVGVLTAVLLLTAAPSLKPADKDSLRYDGVYQTQTGATGQDQFLYLRFYPEGHVVAMASVWMPEKVASFISRSRSELPQGEYYGPGDVARYLSKGRFSSAADCEGANTYELRKFNRADWIYISPGAWAEMREARTVARRMSPLPS
jgi:hypothetical protein